MLNVNKECVFPVVFSQELLQLAVFPRWIEPRDLISFAFRHAIKRSEALVFGQVFKLRRCVVGLGARSQTKNRPRRMDLQSLVKDKVVNLVNEEQRLRACFPHHRRLCVHRNILSYDLTLDENSFNLQGIKHLHVVLALLLVHEENHNPGDLAQEDHDLDKRSHDATFAHARRVRENHAPARRELLSSEGC